MLVGRRYYEHNATVWALRSDNATPSFKQPSWLGSDHRRFNMAECETVSCLRLLRPAAYTLPSRSQQDERGRIRDRTVPISSLRIDTNCRQCDLGKIIGYCLVVHAQCSIVEHHYPLPTVDFQRLRRQGEAPPIPAPPLSDRLRSRESCSLLEGTCKRPAATPPSTLPTYIVWVS